MTELLRLRRQVDELQAELARARTAAPKGAEGLSQGEDVHRLNCTVSTFPPGKHATEHWGYFVDGSWNEIFSSVAPLMIHEAPDTQLKKSLDDFVVENLRSELAQDRSISGRRVIKITLDEQDFQTVKIQLRALGLVTKSDKARSVKDSGTYWTLTAYGDEVMTRLRAIRKNAPGAGANELGPPGAG